MPPQTGFSWFNFFALCAAVIVGFVAVFCWALFFQKKKKRKRRHRGHDRIKTTLAESGGLPPIRPPRAGGPDSNPPFDP